MNHHDRRRRGAPALLMAALIIMTAAGCGGSASSASNSPKPGSNEGKKAATTPKPVVLNASQQATLGAAAGLAIARCTIGNVPGGGSQDSQIRSHLTGFVALYKQVGGQATLGAGKATTLSAEAQKMTDQLSCDQSLAQILVSGTGTISSGGAPTTTATAASNPQVEAVCTKILADVRSLGTGSPRAVGQYGKDVAKLIPIVSESQQTTVFKSVGDIEKVLQAMSTGAPGNVQVHAMVGDASKIGAICGGA